MLPKWHILIGFSISYILVYFFNFSLIAGITIFLTSFLIDFDHYLIFVKDTKNISIKKAYFWAIEEQKLWRKLTSKEKHKIKLHIFLFHGIEFLIILIILSFLHEFFQWVLIGFMIHMVADIIDLIYKEFPIYAKLSIIYIWQTNKNKKPLK